MQIQDIMIMYFPVLYRVHRLEPFLNSWRFLVSSTVHAQAEQIGISTLEKMHEQELKMSEQKLGCLPSLKLTVRTWK